MDYDNTNPTVVEERSVLVALGRQRVGKTSVLNATVQYFRALGTDIEVWNADQQNRSFALDVLSGRGSAPAGHCGR